MDNKKNIFINSKQVELQLERDKLQDYINTKVCGQINPSMSLKIKLAIENLHKGKIETLKTEKLPGDASDRSFYRYSYKTGGAKKSLIVMELQEGFSGKNLSFIDVQEHLKKSGLRVPEIYGFDGDEKFLLLEDLGDETMERRLSFLDGKRKKNLYEKAVALLVHLQVKASIPKKPKSIAFTLSFDVEKFMFELNFFREHYLEGLLMAEISNDDLINLNNEFLKLSQKLAQEPRVFAHRDYHSRNLMVVGNELAMVDFQDARMGLCQYDLASLLRDSYVVLDDSLRDGLIEYYILRIDEHYSTNTDRKEFRKLFDFMSVQRNIKAIGTFAFQKMGKGNDFYLQYIPDTLRYVKENLEKYEELKGLKDFFVKYI
ncbi:MAG: hypothetical protein A2043_05405 [Candidatus Schekmanbacteria bacterium GWA2_38_9]|uniref:Aminoglycoside phosphotransferase domain-containing protein n=1 Tax=Candidatus Schekmanbacteria bacterium RIFCSPLOWO2_12_FULL_38_15 TaxID=1817883 RepID=A0A1F7SQG6_9BACT|nr:MAG: hypothetical protein A2043_05405 [Candidatus Schekmanbacteria bacterium GWA2_38_9]OGL50221.1 MAG: hypothetical protein A3H37_00500 [Candidatus Schekmanbacteria bacterium RIFCSPLOWO2_02_FULL_38_14]OGL55468.1 MAG: hypothetical protein A3G31_01500 [Candidatus Schekmanbacteria bacterium RIFCSPLOWO2_12_FULL_38_15]